VAADDDAGAALADADAAGHAFDREARPVGGVDAPVAIVVFGRGRVAALRLGLAGAEAAGGLDRRAFAGAGGARLAELRQQRVLDRRRDRAEAAALGLGAL